MTSQLRTMLDEAADARPPIGLAQRAVEEATHRRRRRAVITGSVLAAAALVAGGAVALRPAHSDTAPQPIDVASVPVELPTPEDLPTLAEAPMDAASVAYVVDGRLVLVSAADGHAAVDSAAAVPVGRISSVTLSPDGRYAVLVRSWSAGVNTAGLPMSLFDVAAHEETAISLIQARVPTGGGPLQQQDVTWAPDASWFACACTAEGSAEVALVERIDAQDGTVDSLVGWRSRTTGLSWGQNGLAVRDSDVPRWRLAPTYQLVGGHGGGPGWPVIGSGSAAVMAGQDVRHYLTADVDSYRVWSSLGAPMPGSLGSERLTVVSDATKGFLLGTRPASAAGAGDAPIRVRWVSYFNELRDLTQLPAGTSSASFAAALIGDPTEAPGS